MNNKTIERIEIKMRGDNVYDIYVNGNWIDSAGYYMKALLIVADFIEAKANKPNVVSGLVKFTNSAV